MLCFELQEKLPIFICSSSLKCSKNNVFSCLKETVISAQDTKYDFSNLQGRLGCLLSLFPTV